MDEIIRDDFRRLHDFVKVNNDDADSPIVWIAQIVEKLARTEYYKHHAD